MESDQFIAGLLKLSIQADIDNQPANSPKKKPLSHLFIDSPQAKSDREVVYKAALGSKLEKCSLNSRFIGMEDNSLNVVIIYAHGSISAPVNANIFKMVKTLLSLGYDIEP